MSFDVPKVADTGRFARKALAPQLALLVFLTALPLLALSLLMFSEMAVIGRENSRAALRDGARTLAALVDNEIDTHAAIATTLAHADTLRRGDLTAFWERAKRSVEMIPGSWLELRDPSGTPILNTTSPLRENMSRNADADPTPLVLGQIQVSDVAKDETTNRWVAFLTVPLLRRAVPEYILAIALSPDRFLALI